MSLDRIHAQAMKVALDSAEIIRGSLVVVAQDRQVRGTGEYVRGWQSDGVVQVTKDVAFGTQIEIVVTMTNTSPHASIVEDGHAAYRLPEKIDWNRAPRVKRNKDGDPYLHIPIRWRAYATQEQIEAQGLTPATVRRMLPEDVYKETLELGHVTPKRVGPIYRDGKGGKRQFVQADRYKYPKRKPHRLTGTKDPRHEGLMRTGTPGHTQLLTILTLTPESKGWLIPAQEGKHIVRDVMATAPRLIEPLILSHLGVLA